MPRKSDHAKMLLVFAAGFLLGIGAFSALLYEPQACETAPPAPQQPAPPAIGERSATVHILAIDADTGKGLIGTAAVELMPGQGRVLISTNPFIEPDTQRSVAIAKKVAENYTGMSLDKSDIIVSFNLPVEGRAAQVVGGPSAGAALSLAIIAAVMNMTVANTTAITGTVMPDGTVGQVAGVLEKATAAAEAGMKLLIVPAGQASVTYYEKIAEREYVAGYTITRITYAPRSMELNDYTQQWNMTTVAARTIAEAAQHAIGDLAAGR